MVAPGRAPGPIATIGDLPFVERPIAALLGIDGERETIDVDYTGYGWARVDRIWLATGGRLTRVDDALVLALHSADDGEALADDVELEFVLPAAGSVAALLSSFLTRWLPRLPAAPAIVLAMCNPHHARLAAVAAAGGRPVHYGRGDVDAWLDPGADQGRDRLRLVADAWERA